MIKEIEVVGSRAISDATIRDVVQKSISDYSFLTRLLGIQRMFVWPHEIEPHVFSHIPAVTRIRVKKSYWDRRLTLDVQERESFGVWCRVPAPPLHVGTSTDGVTEESTRCFWFDQEGVLYRESLAVDSGSLVRTVYDYTGRPLVLRETVIPEAFLAPLISIFEALSFAQIPVQRIELYTITNEEVLVVADDWPTLFFSLRFKADATRGVLSQLKVSGRYATLTSVDFRVENRVYYK